MNRQWLLASRPTGEPTPENFELVETEVPELGDEGSESRDGRAGSDATREPREREVLVRTLYLSVDPYMRGRMRDAESYAEPWDVGEPMKAGVVGEVVESNHSDYAEGDVVQGNLLWAEYAIADGDDLTAVDPDVGPVSTALGVLGMPGVTAYWGLLDVGDPKPGDTLVVSGAAGAVGSVVGQVGKLAGCRVVGVAGADEKCDWLTDDLEFDAAVNYEADLKGGLREACPDGVDVYFDNVGGPVTDAVWPLLNVRARVAVCGQISQYNATDLPTGPRKLGRLVQTRARVEGLLVRDYRHRWGEAIEQLAAWVESGDVQYREHVVEGFENAPEAFLGLFEGVNIGKQLVEVAEPEHADLS